MSVRANPSVADASTSLPISRRELPTAPPPSATVDETQVFFVECFLALRPTWGQEEAEMKAKKFLIGGVGLYAYTVEGFESAFGGDDGRAIFQIIHNGYYSYVSSISTDMKSYLLINIA